MAYRTPGNRTFSLDIPSGGALVDITTLIRTIDGMEQFEATLEDVTGPGDTRPVLRNAGFGSWGDITLEVDWEDESATWDIREDIVNTISTWGTTRTFKALYFTGETFTIETLIKSCKPKTPNKGETAYTLVLTPTGSETIAVA